MSTPQPEIESPPAALEAFLLGSVEFDRALDLQRRLIAQCAGRNDGQIVLLLCEHPAVVTIGRDGSPGDVAVESGLIRSGRVEVRWVNRGGGSWVHCPGQLAVYPLAPLRWHGFTVGEFLRRFSRGIVQSLEELNLPVQTQPAEGLDMGSIGATADRGLLPGVWGRTGQLAAVGVAVRHWVTYYGAYINVCPPMGLFRLVERNAPGRPKFSSLVAERHGPVKMTAVRATLIRRLAESFGCDRYHLYTGHPWLCNTIGRRTGNR